MLALVPIGLIGLWLIIGDLLKPDSDEIQQRLLAEIAAHPGQKVSLTTQFLILYGRTLPISVVFGILILVAGIRYETCAHYLVLRHANGQPTSLAEALRVTKPRMLPFLGQSILAALILVVGALTPPVLGTIFLPDGTKIIGNIVPVRSSCSSAPSSGPRSAAQYWSIALASDGVSASPCHDLGPRSPARCSSDWSTPASPYCSCR